MKTSTGTSCMMAMLACFLAWPFPSYAASSLPDEPDEECLVAQSYDTIAGLLLREYSLRRNGRVDYRTARQIMGVSYDDPAAGELDIAPHPLFYWYDADQDGQWEMWVDRDGEGRPADMARYDWRQGEELITSSKTW